MVTKHGGMHTTDRLAFNNHRQITEQSVIDTM
jgi:hypothetical protein